MSRPRTPADEAWNATRRARTPILERICGWCTEPFATRRGNKIYCSKGCSREASWARVPLEQQRAHVRLHELRRREQKRFSDLTAADVAALLTLVTCPLCGAKMSEDHRDPRARNLDHIVPCIGGTHTRNNVRVICRTCNLRRPRDGSDLAQPDYALDPTG